MIDKLLVEVLVKDYGKTDFRTFSYLALKSDKLKIGSIVMVPFGKKISLGVIYDMPTSSNKKTNYRILDIKQKLNYPPLPGHLLSLSKWLCEYYIASPKAILQTILPSGLNVKNIRQNLSQNETYSIKKPAIKLNSDQKKAIKTISLSKSRTFLLHGVTGSGKTEVYIELIKKQLELGKSSIVLVPEISLTPQTVERFRSHFPEQILLTHSKLTSAKRRNLWLEALNSSKPKIVIGPRSALFMPLKSLGLIIIDEEHEDSYKQESSPRYNAIATAAKLSDLSNCKLVLGSATPSINTYFLVKAKKIKLVELKNRAQNQALPKVKIVELTKQSNLLSDELSQAIKQTLLRQRQVILFLNRRGSANALICANCGQNVKCPSCSTSLSFHADKNKLICHYCGFSKQPDVQCPDCKSYEMIFVGAGTKKLEQQLRADFKNARLARIDKDNSDFEHLNKVYEDLKNGKIDILIGTQMIARGLDIAGVDLVGVILADNMLTIPDFSSHEKAFNLLTQVSGRAGRGLAKASSIIQTFAPESAPIVSAKDHDYAKFYKQEILNRKKYVYPPYCYLLKLTYSHKNEKSAFDKAADLAKKLQIEDSKIIVLGPSNCLIKKRANKYRFQVIIKAFDRAKLTKIALGLPAGWNADIDPINLM